MVEASFTLLLVLPSFAMVFVVLTTYVGSARAYMALSWVPLAICAVLWAFRQLDFLGNPAGDLGPLARAVRWTVLAQVVFGAVLLWGASERRESYGGLVVATLAVTVGYLLLG